MSGRTANQPGSYVFGALVGLLVAWGAYQWVTDSGNPAQKEREIAAVQAARQVLQQHLGMRALVFVDPVSPDRKVGKSYVYPAADGWEISGHYRRDDNDDWHAFLVRLDAAHAATLVRVRDEGNALTQRAESDPVLELVP